MNKFIKAELCKAHVQLPPYNDLTTQIIIPKGVPRFKENETLVGKLFTISIDEYLVEEPDNFNFSKFWNKGITPPESKLLIKVLEEKSKIVKVYAQGYTTKIT